MNPIQIVEYRKEYQRFFEAFNKAWIEKYFWLEEVDQYVLQNPEQAILQKGGAILIAKYNGLVAGVVALKKVSKDVYEFTKMAVEESFRRKGIAEALSHAAFDKAKELGADKVILYSQTALVPAITMYRKLGFKEVPMEKGVYKRSDIKMEIELQNVKVDVLSYEKVQWPGNYNITSQSHDLFHSNNSCLKFVLSK
jgi:ribosomal protein S18 acetylase RimI-like enzyme